MAIELNEEVCYLYFIEGDIGLMSHSSGALVIDFAIKFFVAANILFLPANPVLASQQSENIENFEQQYETEKEIHVESTAKKEELDRLRSLLESPPKGFTKWGEAGHRYTTFIVARLAGVDDENAYKLAYYSQFPDDEVSFSATMAFFYLWNLDYRKTIMADLHSLHGGDEEEVLHRREKLRDLIQQGLKLGTLDVSQIGLLIHAFGDAYSHVYEEGDEVKAFSYVYGHLFHGHEPDLIFYNPERFKEFTCNLYTALADQQNCSPGIDELHEMIGESVITDDELVKFLDFAVDRLSYDKDIIPAFEEEWKKAVDAELVSTLMGQIR